MDHLRDLINRTRQLRSDVDANCDAISELTEEIDFSERINLAVQKIRAMLIENFQGFTQPVKYFSGSYYGVKDVEFEFDQVVTAYKGHFISRDKQWNQLCYFPIEDVIFLINTSDKWEVERINMSDLASVKAAET